VFRLSLILRRLDEIELKLDRMLVTLRSRNVSGKSETWYVKLDHGGHRFPQTRVEAYNTLLLEFFRAHAERDVPGAG